MCYTFQEICDAPAFAHEGATIFDLDQGELGEYPVISISSYLIITLSAQATAGFSLLLEPLP